MVNTVDNRSILIGVDAGNASGNLDAVRSLSVKKRETGGDVLLCAVKGFLFPDFIVPAGQTGILS